MAGPKGVGVLLGTLSVLFLGLVGMTLYTTPADHGSAVQKVEEILQAVLEGDTALASATATGPMPLQQVGALVAADSGAVRAWIDGPVFPYAVNHGDTISVNLWRIGRAGCAWVSRLRAAVVPPPRGGVAWITATCPRVPQARAVGPG